MDMEIQILDIVFLAVFVFVHNFQNDIVIVNWLILFDDILVIQDKLKELIIFEPQFLEHYSNRSANSKLFVSDQLDQLDWLELEVDKVDVLLDALAVVLLMFILVQESAIYFVN